ncbi:MAG: glycoside hydrolase family 127 protein [Pirellulales bacterium]|nr:glycoside hydrolase family 127 protein [Pirellulales bacterium]
MFGNRTHVHRISGLASSFLGLALLATASLVHAAPTESGAAPFVPLVPGKTSVGGEIGRRMDLTIRKNILAVNVDRDFLRPFRDKKSTGRMGQSRKYVGLGKFILALVEFGAQTDDAKVLALKDRVIGELLKTQLPDGYMGIFQEKDRVFTLWDLHEMVYLIQGLVADYRQSGNEASLDAARKLADYIMQHRKSTDKPRLVGKLGTERAFIALGRATRENKYTEYGVGGMDLPHWNAPVAGHAYTFMNVCLAQLDLYDMSPDEKLLRQSRRVIDQLRAHDSLLVSGSCTRREGFHTDQRLDGNVSETCATAYLIRLLHRMLCLEGKPIYGDMMERAIHNALFAAQLPDGRRLRYFTPLGGRRPIYPHDTYCCPNNFRRIVAELPSMVYYRAGGGLAVNLFTASSATVPIDKGVRVKVQQETDYPTSGNVLLRLDPSIPARFPLRLQIPAWCKNATVRVNGEKAPGPVTAGTFFVVDRLWERGDLVAIDMPMTWRLVRGRKLQEGRVAVLRGPMVYCLDPEWLVALNPAVAKKLDELPLDEKGRKARREQLSKLVRGLRLDPKSLGEPVKDTTRRPDGLACPARAWSPGKPLSEPPDLKLKLTEFPDPGGEATYFLVPDLSGTVDDELLDMSK